MTDQAPAGDGSLDPDVSEEELGSELDNIVPTYGYHLPRVVGLGGSAGSIAAMQKFFAGVPGDCGMAFVVVMHLSPEHDSLLSEILQRSSALRVSTAGDGQKVEPNHVYVIPPGRQITLADGHLRLTPLPREPGQRMTVDRFFRSLADTHGPHAVAIVLSGGDGDGALGIKRVKERGGLTIAQDPEAAEQAGMPRAAIATSMVDWVLRVEDMPERLLQYHAREKRLHVPPETGPNPAAAPKPDSNSEEAALRDVLTFLRARTGRDFTYYKRATIVRRIARRMQVSELDSLTAYLTYLRTHPGESGALLQDLLISVTNFFRDREAFDALEKIIPELFRNKTQADTVRVWVPACATGEEAYSIAMLLTEHARTLESPPALQIFATDLDEDVLAEARAGVYPEAISADVSADRLRRFLVKEHHGYRVRRELREIVLFAVHDLLKDSPFSRLDLVSCRNLLIYLNRDAQKRVFEIFHFSLRSDGYLFLGTSESVDDASQTFFPVDKKHRIYGTRRTLRASLPVPVGQSALARALAVRERSEGATLPRRPPSSATFPENLEQPAPERMGWAELHLNLLDRFGPPSLIVNSDYEILHLSEGVTPFLHFASGEPSANLLKVIHPALRLELRAALYRARHSGASSSVERVPIELGDQQRLVDMRVAASNELAGEFLLVTFALREDNAPTPSPLRDADEPVVRHLERELEQTKGQLRDIVEQHDAFTEELKASNEELQAMNEELRSATEELETSREELQSINEELTTVNQELKNKVDELGHANSDLHNLMGATAIATVFLDRDLHIMRFTPSAVELFRLIPGDVGRPLSDLQHRLAYPSLLEDAARVLRQLAPVEREVGESGGRFFLARLLPYRTTEDRIAGVVLTFVDITERQLAQRALERAQQELEQRVLERTAQLDALNEQLRQEVKGHQLAEKARQELQRRLVAAQEEERSRISRELHDAVGQELAALMLSLKSLEQSSASEAQGKLREQRALAEKVAAEIHQLAFELRPVALDELGLARALAGYLENWQARTGINVDFVNIGIEHTRLPRPIETTVYRVVQEAMNNVYKHAHASHVSVSVERRSGAVVALVEDDGAGFDVDSLHVHGEGRPRIGIAGMRERAAIVGGELTIESSPGAGATVRMKIPLTPSVSPPPAG
jgi:two-component system, chemotaxis family, CheB/CheR fusion protein